MRPPGYFAKKDFDDETVALPLMDAIGLTSHDGDM